MRRALIRLVQGGGELNRHLMRNTPSQCYYNSFSPIIINRFISLTGCTTGSKSTSLEDVGLGDAPKDSEGRDSKDRTMIIPVETSIKYLESDAYKTTYGDDPVWVLYRRNFKGQFAPKRTRLNCIKHGKIDTGSPCPICRDEYLVVDYRNVKLLKQFISPVNGSVLHWDRTGVCRQRELEIRVAIEKARDYGTISFDVPFREYDYDEYYNSNPLFT